MIAAFGFLLPMSQFWMSITNIENTFIEYICTLGNGIICIQLQKCAFQTGQNLYIEKID